MRMQRIYVSTDAIHKSFSYGVGIESLSWPFNPQIRKPTETYCDRINFVFFKIVINIVWVNQSEA